MNNDFSNALSNISCIDLLNATWEDIHNLCLISNVANGFKLYIKHLHTSLHDDLFNLSNPHLVYFDNDYIIGTIRKGQNIEKFLLGGLEILPDTQDLKMDSQVFNELENQLITNQSIELSKETVYFLVNAFKDIIVTDKYNTNFVQMHIEVNNQLAIPYLEFCENYNQEIVFLNCENPTDVNELILSKIFYRHEQPIIYTFKNKDKLVYMGWNKNFLFALKELKPFHFYPIRSITKINAILDKINNVGLSNLDTEEKYFLENYSKS